MPETPIGANREALAGSRPHCEMKANRLHLLSKDAFRAIQLIEKLQQLRAGGLRDPDVHSAIMIAAIVVYARSFKKSHNSIGNADSLVKFGDLELSADPDMLDLHERCIAARDTMIAHSDWNNRSSIVIERFDGESVRGVLRASTASEGWEGLSEQGLMDLFHRIFQESRRLSSSLDSTGLNSSLSS